ncbi:cobalt-precorrin-5B (C(1))-methyltransferase CbiD [Porphyromonas pogonae]|uniref:cobalt-precorrin-5B (C(1))-methyltransferase CbiD n=1 Tax=Porphyromonas pogonae TaxID=867595 RepID=UPI002E759F64|nr:cobalt-precorrin-5B (C(1))-methyltransferase CbiD [Porphyromonas pogonae]
MILVFGGTTEGRLCIEVLEEAGKAFYYATKGALQQVTFKNGIPLTGAMDVPRIVEFCTSHGILLIIDAAHPFAENLHSNIEQASLKLKIPVVRIQRNFDLNVDGIFCDDYNDATRKLKSAGVKKLLALTGVNTIAKLKDFWTEHETYFRILDRDESNRIVTDHHFPQDHILYFDFENPDDESIMHTIHPDAVITKESGSSGYFEEKAKMCQRYHTPLYIIRRPRTPKSFVSVEGKVGLRKAIENLCPTFFPLRSGYTTGSCATAATKAALVALLTDDILQEVSITLPQGEQVILPISKVELHEQYAEATVIKDSGDDPDITNGISIVSRVEVNNDSDDIVIDGGEGVGRVTLPGLGIEVGGPAINTTPRSMIRQAVRECCECGVHVTISVPQGYEIGKKTFNPRLGIVDGISIIGTSGVVKPYSSEAFIASITRQVSVAQATLCDMIVINSGGKSENFLKAIFPDKPAQIFVQYGNFIGETLREVNNSTFKQVYMGIMIGKAVKLAEGNLDTHSKKVVMNKNFLCSVAHEVNALDDLRSIIENITLARELLDKVPSRHAHNFFTAILRHCYETCKPCIPHSDLQILLIEESGKVNYKYPILHHA